MNSILINKYFVQFRLIVSFILTAALLFAYPSLGFASVQSTDEILGETASDLNLSVSQCPNIDGKYAVLVDEYGEVYFSRDAYSSAKIASITKIMTAIIAVENSNLSDSVTISSAAAEIGESTADLSEGDVLDMESALKALLVPSGNDAAVAIAQTVGNYFNSGSSDPIAAFVSAMNAKAIELGCSDTVFTNPHGLDADGYEGDLHSTAYDVSIISRYALTNDTIRSIVAGGTTTITVLRGADKVEIELETTDLMLELYRYTIGIKTGSTELAGPCFSGAISRNGKELYAVVLNSSSETQRFYDCIALFDWYFDHIKNYKLCNTTEHITEQGYDTSAQIPVVAYIAHSDWLDKTFAATFNNTEASVEVFDLNGNVSQDFVIGDVHGTVKKGDKIGVANFYQHNDLIASLDLIAAEDCSAPNPIQAIGMWFARLFSGITGKATVADSIIVNTMPLIVDKTIATN